MTFLEACWHWLSRSGTVVTAVSWLVYMARASMPSMLTALIDSVEQKKAQLDGLRPLPASILAQLQKHYNIDLTDTSNEIEQCESQNPYAFDLTSNCNAIEGNTLPLCETVVLIKRGLSIICGPWDNLAGYWIDFTYYDAAVPWLHELATQTALIGASTVRELHGRIAAMDPAIGGIYRQGPIKGSPVDFPDPAKIPALMEEFGAWLQAAPPDPASAFEAHSRLTEIYPFLYGNERTARILTNLLLIHGGYPPVAVRWEDRKTYGDALKWGWLDGDLRPFQIFMHERLDAALAEYLTALALPDATAPQAAPKL